MCNSSSVYQCISEFKPVALFYVCQAISGGTASDIIFNLDLRILRPFLKLICFYCFAELPLLEEWGHFDRSYVSRAAKDLIWSDVTRVSLCQARSKVLCSDFRLDPTHERAGLELEGQPCLSTVSHQNLKLVFIFLRTLILLKLDSTFQHKVKDNE